MASSIATTSNLPTTKDTSCVQEAVKVPLSECNSKKGNVVHESPVGIVSVPSPPETKDSRKSQNNKKPSQRPRVKKHRPEILDNSEPKKVPKGQTPWVSAPRLKTPNPATAEQVRERRKQVKKNTFTGSTSCMQNSTSYGHKDVQEVQGASKDSIIAGKPFKCSLDIDYHLVKEESHNVPKSDEQPMGFNFDLGKIAYFRKFVPSNRNTPRRSRFEKKCFKSSEDLLGDNTQQCQQNISVVEDQERVETYVRRYGKVYQHRKKNISKATTFIPVLQVYPRKFREDQCEKNSRKCGPIFPRMFKKQWAKRKNWWYDNAVEDGKSHVRRSITKKGVHNSVKKSEDHKELVKSNLQNDEKFLGVFSPNKMKQSTRHTRRIENIMNLFQHEENIQKIRECVPLQEAPVLETQSLQPFSKEYLSNLYASEMTAYLTRKLENLDINGPCKELVVREHNVSGAIVKIDPPRRKRKVLPKVELDKDTLRVWKLTDTDKEELWERQRKVFRRLLDSFIAKMHLIRGKSVEETDTDKEELWERQRKVFRGLVDSFIAEMHLIQGNWRFSPWKGSIVDSGVGVYLTQNMSDRSSRLRVDGGQLLNICNGGGSST